MFSEFNFISQSAITTGLNVRQIQEKFNANCLSVTDQKAVVVNAYAH